MWCSYNKTTTHSDNDCRARPANRLNGNSRFAPSSSSECSWGLQLVGSCRTRLLQREAMHLILGKRGPACDQGRQSSRGRGEGSQANRPGLDRGNAGVRTRLWSFTPRAEPALSFGGSVAEETSNLCYMFGMTNDEKPVAKALMALSSIASISEERVNSDLTTLMVDSGASGHYFDGAIIRDLKHRLQAYVHLATPRKILTSGGAMLTDTAEGVMQVLVTDDNGSQTLVWVDIVVVPGIRRNLFSVMTATSKGTVTIFDYERPRLDGFNVAMLLRSESGDLYSFVLDLSADRYGTKEQAVNAIANAQVWHRRLGHLHCTEPGYSTQARRYWYHIRGGCLGLPRLRRGKCSTACSLQDSQPQGQPAFPAVLRGSDGVLHATDGRRLHVRQQDNRRVHQVDRRLLVDQQKPSSSVASTVHWLDGHSFRRLHRSLVRR